MYLEGFQDDSDALCDRFDRMEGLYYVSMLWHGGQWSVLYRLGCRCGFRPSPLWTGRLDRSEDAQARHYAARYLCAVRARLRSGKPC